MKHRDLDNTPAIAMTPPFAWFVGTGTRRAHSTDVQAICVEGRAP